MARDKEKYNAYQREYQKKYQLKKYHAWREESLLLLGGECVVCGSVEDLHIDHVNASDKLYEVSSLFSRKREIWLNELAKCQLLCETHHKEKTLLFRDNSWMFSENENKHGCGYQYVVKKCRCTPCRAWGSLYKKGEVQYSDVLTPKQVDAVSVASRYGYGTDEIKHGTRAGYLKEGRLGLERCEACKKANAEYTRSRKRP